MARSIITGRFARTEDTLREIAERLIYDMRQELTKDKRIASGELLDSFVYSGITDLNLQIESKVDYAGSVDRGYDGPEPPVGAIIRWAKLKNIRPTYRTGRNSGRPMSISQFAKFTARKIGRYGYQGSDYVSKAFLGVSDLINRGIGEAYAQDIEEMLEQNITLK